MIEVALNNVSKSFGGTNVLDNVNIEILTQDRIGLIGRNGTGKTTLFKIITALEPLDQGQRILRKNLTIGYLDQIPEYTPDISVKEVLNEAFSNIFILSKKMKDLEAQMASVSDQNQLDAIMKTYGETQTKFEDLHGYDVETKISTICSGLNISEKMLARKFMECSGGEKSTIMLAKLLLLNCNLLLLDEPTNHLDTDSQEWLENFLSTFKGTVVSISHDRYFLDQTANKIIELEDGSATLYYGNYSDYVKEKEKNLLLQFEDYKTMEKKVKAMQAAIRRFRDWGNRSGNPKMFKKAANMEKRIERLQQIDKPIMDRNKIALNFNPSGRSGRDVITIKQVTKSYANTPLLENIDCKIRFGERVAILGKNGRGKSTVIKLIMQQIAPDTGEIIIGSRVTCGYLAQNISFENESHSVLNEIRTMFNLDEGKARAYLAKFLFYKDDVFKKIHQLSGGEKTRLKLCLLMHQNNNLLVLDEPTNHLDIDSREMLEESLLNYKGTIIFISHDRFFINKLAQRILMIEKKKFHPYPGNYDDYQKKKAQEALSEVVVVEQPKGLKIKKGHAPKKQNDNRLEKQKANQKKKLEAKLEQLEQLIIEITQKMEDNPTDYVMQEKLYIEKCDLQNELDNVFEDYVALEEAG